MKQAMLGAMALLPPAVFMGGMAGVTILMLASFAGSQLVDRALDRREGKTPEPPNPDQPPTWTHLGYMYPMMAGMLILPLFLFIPSLALLPGATRRLIVFSVMGLVFASAVLIGWLGYRRTRRRLTPGDHWYDEVMTMAKAANVRVRHVQVVTSPSVNAFANIFGTVGLTSALLRKMEPEEVCVIVAHEIGHHKDGHPRRQFLLSLIVVFGLIGIWWVLTDYLDRNIRLPAEAKALMNSPLFAIFILPLLRGLLMGRDQRKQEDRFAVEVTGDPDLVIHTLTKIHTLDATPHELKPSDEIISSHPSLKNRIEAIRRTFLTTDRAAPAPSETGAR
jgi:Zn-dependent protease with chaperone function